ncbi:MAG: glycogen debranching enzyme, partial [Micromonosporaceae bacterium]
SDLYEHTGRRPVASINFITCHDGFTLSDLVSYQRKHNEANGEDNRDGESHNRSVNCGVEGPTDDPEVNALRGLLKRNALATLFLSQGVPMLSHGDELGRTQQGNNNAYCQDNEISWIDWSTVDQELLEFVQRLAELRDEHPVFRRRRFFDGQPVVAGGLPDIVWFTPDAVPMTTTDWQTAAARAVMVFLNGDGMPWMGPRGEPVTDDSFLLCFNAWHEPVPFSAPSGEYGSKWRVLIDTATPRLPDQPPVAAAGGSIQVGGHAVLVMVRAA